MMKQRLTQLCIANYFTKLLLFGLFLTPSVLEAQIQGKVYRDFSANGVFDSTATFKEIGLSGITVTAYNAVGTSVGTATTNSTGNYTITGVSGAVRVEFTGLSTGDYSGPRAATGTNFSNTSVQFVTAPSTTVNYGINYPDDYCQANPKITFSCYDNGSGAGNTNPVLVQIDYNDTNSGQNEYYTGATADAIGSVFGVAYDRNKKLAYYSAFLKRQAGIGDRGYDGIYVINTALATPALAGGFDLEGVVPSNGGAALAFGTVTRNLIASGNGTGTNDLSASRTNASRDADAYAKVGKVGYGDIDIDLDTKTLWAVNLNERSLVAVNIATNLHTTTIPNTVAGSKVKRYFIDGVTSPFISGLPTCTNGVMRPFGLKIYKGKGYLGVVCDGSSLSTVDMTANQSAYVLSFDLANPTSFTLVTSVPLNYAREQSWVPFSPTTTFDALESDQWQRWRDTYTDPTSFGSTVNSTNQDFKTGLNGGFVGAPQPILSDIEFTSRGDIILGFMDRFAHQQGWANYIPTSSTTTRSGVSHGDMLMAYYNGTGYSLEGPNENDNFTTPSVAVNAQPAQKLNDGPSGAGEFFYKDYYIGFDATHPETALGALGYVPGKQEIVAMMFDPNDFNSQGIRWMSETTGNQTDYYTVIANTGVSNFGKGSALGDVEALCNPAPLEIGNRVWIDADKDGIQDAGEAGVDGVTVKLKLNGTTVATTTTASGGQYYFTGVLADTTYTIVIETFASQTPLSNLTLTTADVGSNGSDLIDNDAVVSTTSAVITYRTGLAGQNAHSLDFGFVCTPPTVTGITATQATCTGSTANSDAAVNVTGISGMTKYSYGTNGATGFFYSTATASTATSISKTGLANPASATTYTFRIYGSDSTCYKDTSVVLNPKTCSATCTEPTGGTVVESQATCNGAVANSDASISITGLVGGDKFAYNTSGGTGLTYASSTAFSGGTITITGLPNPSVSTTYTIRVFNLENDCYVDLTATIAPKTCSAPCPNPNCMTATVIRN